MQVAHPHSIVVLRLPGSWSNWNLEMSVFEERGKPEFPEKNLSEQGREPATNSNHNSFLDYSRIWEIKGGIYSETLTKIQAGAIFRMRDIRRNVLPKCTA